MVTINADMGESFGLHSFGHDDRLVDLIDTANVACGFHAGDPSVLRDTVRKGLAGGLTLGAHPGLPDLVGFGRREMKLEHDEAIDIVLYQVASLVGFLHAEGGELDHIKPHGALYGMAARDEDLMDAICDVAVQYEVPIYGMAGTAHETVTAKRDVPFVAELYVDMRYRADGSLIIVRRPQATPLDEAAARAREGLTEGLVTAETGERIPIRFDSICVHSDTPNAVDVATAIRGVITEEAA